MTANYFPFFQNNYDGLGVRAMHISLQYLQVHRAFANQADHKPTPVTLEELAGIWFCSQRNAKIVLKKLLEAGWIAWNPGRGRGHRSLLAFLVPREQVLLDSAKKLVGKGHLPEALEHIREFGSETSSRELFMDWLSDYFGYRSEPESPSRSRVELLRLPITRPIYRLDPISTFFAIDINVIMQVFDTLVRFDPASGTVVPHLAHSWESDDGQRRWVFRLRKGVLFHHGRGMTADDVAYTFRRLLNADAGSAYKWLFKEISAVRALNATTVEFELSAPHYLFPRFLCSHAASIVPRDVCEQKGASFAKSPVGSGPFQLIANLPSLCTLEAFPSYFQGRAHLDRVEILIVPEDSLTLKQSPWDKIAFHHIHLDQLASQHPNWSAAEELIPGCCLMTFNLRKKDGPQHRLAFRHALHHLTDRGKMIRELNDSRIYCAHSYVPGDVLSAEDYAYNPELGLRLLREAGYQGEPFVLATNSLHAEDAYWLQRQYAAYGVGIRVSILGREEMIEPDVMQQADGYLYNLIIDEEGTFENYRSDLSYIRGHMDDDSRSLCDRIISSLLGEPNEQARAGLLQLLERIQAENRSLLFLTHSKQITSLHPSVQGFRFNSLGWVDFKDIWFLQEDAVEHR